MLHKPLGHRRRKTLLGLEMNWSEPPAYTFDERGNVAQRLSSTAAVQSTDLYDGYGARTGTAAQPDPWGYGGQAGYYADAETGLILCTHRFYDPMVGRFLTRDPLGYRGGINLYGYCGNNSINDDDPDGLARRKGKTPPSSWPAPPPTVVGKNPSWNPDGYWQGGKGGHDVVWDPTGHGGGQGNQDGHWDEDQKPGDKRGGGRRWDRDGRPITFNPPPNDDSIHDDGLLDVILLGILCPIRLPIRAPVRPPIRVPISTPAH